MTQSIQAIRSRMADMVCAQAVRNSFGTGSIQAVLAGMGLLGIQSVLNSLPAYGNQTIRTSSGTGSIQQILTGMGISRLQAINNQLSPAVHGAQAVLNYISPDGAMAVQAIINEISETHRAGGIQVIGLGLKDLEALYPSVSYEIYVDGKPASSRIRSASVLFSESSIHNSITFDSIDGDLYHICDPEKSAGEQRIEMHVGTRVLYFLIEERSGDHQRFTVWGRGISARDDTPHSDEVDFTLDSPQLASDVAAGLLIYCALDWDCDDWVLPDTFEFQGSPIAGIQKLASAIGAIVRAKDDGTILVRKQCPVRPVDVPVSSADVTYSSDTNLIEISHAFSQGDGYDAVVVNGYADEVFLPDLEVEESSPVRGDDVHVRAYWAGQVPASEPAVYVTSGQAEKLGTGTETVTERVVFSEGYGELDYPPTAIQSVEWIGAQGGDISYEQYVTTLSIAGTSARVADITYSAEFDRYRLYNHDVLSLLFTMIVPGGRNISVRVRMGTGSREALEINEPLLTTDAIAVARGVAFLDETHYDGYEMTIFAPYDDDAIDGNLAYLDEENLSLSGNCQIADASIDLNGPRIVNRLVLRQWRAS